MKPIGGGWDEALKETFESENYLQLREFLKSEYRSRVIFPPMEDIYAALRATPLHEVRVVILGQDPYHEPGQAHGLSFSVKKGCPVPPSLQNIYQELIQEGFLSKAPESGDLRKWAGQGVLLLNAVLTVRCHAANSHKGKGWEEVTDAIIRVVNKTDQPVVFLLWGANAGAKKQLLDNPKHLVLQAPHPSPLSAYRGFFGCGHFRKANDFLSASGVAPIRWEEAGL